MDNMQWNKLFSVFFSAEEEGIVIPFALRTSVGTLERKDAHGEKFGSVWQNTQDYHSIKIWLTEENRTLVLDTLEALEAPYTLKGDTVIVVAKPVEGLL
jgi:hypothetical protein